MGPAADSLAALRRGDLAGARELRLPGLSAFPPEILALGDTLELLDLGDGTLKTLPPGMGRLHRLRILFCSGNRFDTLPPPIGDCASLSQIGFRAAGLREVPGEALPPNLRWLTLTDNRIESLPSALGTRPFLQKLMLAGNRLGALPESLGEASRLELLRLGANRFETLPPWLTRLPALAWLSWAGNPAERAPPVDAGIAVPWTDLALGDPIGEGASGRVHRAVWRSRDRLRPVAVKLFKSAMTSDGLPEREMAACLGAGEHPCLAGGLGRVAGHPDGRQGLVMPLIPAEWRVLAGPPSPATCSRDVYGSGFGLPLASAVRLARDIAEAAAHLHARGWLHGDLYAHNVLWDGRTGAAVLSDLGAASALPAGPEGAALARTEVLAWGLLLGELLDRAEADRRECAVLRDLERACTHPDLPARPLMSDVAATMNALAGTDP